MTYIPDKTASGIYIHIPFCRRKCGYCSFVSYEDDSRIGEYVSSLIREIRGRQVDNRSVDTVFFGGGTPSLLTSSQYYTLLNTIYDHFSVSDKCEITTEANPGTVDKVGLKDLHSMGFNRLSLGIQSLDDDDLRYLGRIHDREEALLAIKDARSAGFDNINIDLIYGLPERRPGVWPKVLDEVGKLEITHLSMYALTLEEDTPLARSITLGKHAPLSDDMAADDYDAVDRAGLPFEQYEISNWALPGLECQHNLKYWHRHDYHGFGVAAHSCVGRERFANTGDLKGYIDDPLDSVDFREELDDEKMMGETIMLALRTSEGVRFDDISRIFNVKFEDRFGHEISDLMRDGLVERSSAGIRLTKRARLLGNQVFMRFI